jgi:hypothetical protein
LTKKIHSQRVDEHAAGDDAEGAADAGQRAPDAERDVALTPRREGDREQRKGGGREQRRADALHGADGDERSGGTGEPAGERRCPEQREAGEEHAAAPEQVARAPAEQQQATEGKRVGVDDPLQPVSREPEVGLDRGQCDVHDRDVEDDHELGDGEDGQGEPFGVGS